jgi:hypothetical protein
MEGREGGAGGGGWGGWGGRGSTSGSYRQQASHMNLIGLGELIH